jgi:hypothetical protein
LLSWRLIKHRKIIFLYHIAYTIGLLKPLKESFPKNWKEIFKNSFFLIFENKAYHEIDDFIKDNITFKVDNLAEQRSSNLSVEIDS